MSAIRAASSGGGVQSTAMLVLSAQREIDFPLHLFDHAYGKINRTAKVLETPPPPLNARSVDARGGLMSNHTQSSNQVNACCIDGCDRPVVARGWCKRHYGRWYKHGDPTTLLRRNPEEDPSRLASLTPFEIGYLAGIIDGEGTISVAFGRSTAGTMEGITFRVSVGNTNRPLLEWLVETCGGAIYDGKSYMPNARPYWSWAVSGKFALAVVELVEPHLKIKTRQAALSHQIAALTLPSYGDNRLRVLTDDLRIKREELVKEFRRLNKKGVGL